MLGDGSEVRSSVFYLRSVMVGNNIVENVTASTAPAKGKPLLGQSFLSRFKSWSLDNSKQALILEGPAVQPIVSYNPEKGVGNFGAIAFSRATGAVGHSYNYGSSSAAEQTAVAACGSDCSAVVWFQNACGALAVGARRGYGASWGHTQSEAESKAMSTCETYTAGCGIVRWACTSH